IVSGWACHLLRLGLARTSQMSFHLLSDTSKSCSAVDACAVLQYYF
uniref:Tubulin polyglutamylase TTLL4 n=1 Tax=Parascaris univalens TaxID=6257 RepID=A0A915ATB1_PARUN